MTPILPRKRTNHHRVVISPKYLASTGKMVVPAITEKYGSSISTLWKSIGNPVNRRTGKRESGGAFHVTHSGDWISPGQVSKVVLGNAGDQIYSGPCMGNFVPVAAIEGNYQGTAEDRDVTDLDPDGATAISLCAPNNPTANLSTAIAETMREGIPSLPGIQSWRKRTEIAKAAGSEYLNAQFGWNPLVSEVNNVVNSARYHRDIMQNYEHNEGRNVHRRFDFPDETQVWSEEISPQNAVNWTGAINGQSGVLPPARRVTYVENVRKRWFEGCFTYGGPSKTDSFGHHLGFGTEADAVYGLTLSPDVLWNLTPWSWAVDWFTNTGDVIHNITNFAAAGLVMRYGYMMEESISTYKTQYSDSGWKVWLKTTSPTKKGDSSMGACARGKQTVSRTRAPANPFGFGVGWEGLSPTQLAITAAIGITRFL